MPIETIIQVLALLAALVVAAVGVWWSLLKESPAPAVFERSTLDQYRAAIEQECAAIQERSRLREVRIRAEMEEDRMETEHTLKRLQDTSRLNIEHAMQEQTALFTRLSTNFMQAVFDPELPEEQRARTLRTVQALLEVHQQESAQDA